MNNSKLVENIGLLEAARSGNLSKIKDCLEKGADIHYTENNEFGFTALHLAAMNNHNLIVKVLIDRGANPNFQTTTYQQTPAHRAAREGHFVIVKTLINRGSDLFLRTKAGETLLHKAVFSGNDDLVEFLMQNGVDPFIPDIDGNTPLHYAARSGDVDCASAITEHISSQKEYLINFENKSQQTASDVAKTFQHYHFIEWLEFGGK